MRFDIGDVCHPNSIRCVNFDLMFCRRQPAPQHPAQTHPYIESLCSYPSLLGSKITKQSVYKPWASHTSPNNLGEVRLLAEQRTRHLLFAYSVICSTCTPVDITRGCVNRDPSGTLQVDGLIRLIKQFWLEGGGLYGYRKVSSDLRELGKVVVRTGFIV